jgi:ABC-type multidrug transport system fused ATPase/permease subunit
MIRSVAKTWSYDCLVLDSLRKPLAFFTPREKAKYLKFLALRAMVGLFDLVGILAIGFLATSIALFVTLGSDSERIISFAGLTIPAITAQTLPLVAGMILFLFLSKALLAILLTSKLARFLATIEARAARKVGERAFSSGLTEARQYSREEIYFAVQSGSPAAFNSLLNAWGTIFAEGVLFVLVIGSFLFVDPVSGLGAVLYFGLIAVIIQIFIGNLMQNSATITAKGVVAANSAIGDLSEVVREANTLAKTPFFLDKILFARLGAATSSARQFVLGGMPRYIIETALIVAVAFFVLFQASQGDIASAAGTLGVFLSGGLRLTASLLPLQSAVLVIKQALPVAQKALDFLSGPDLSAPLTLDYTRESQHPNPIDVELSQVTYFYPGARHAAISDVSLRIKPGQQAAFIGVSGAGKSTIADLIVGLVDCSSGAVTLDTMPPKQRIALNPGVVGLVPQKPGLISGTIAENIALGLSKEQIDETRLNQAVNSAHLLRLIEDLPEGMQTDIGKRRDELSGGQLQRIGLARALYYKPLLLVMDEATSSLDAESESEIHKALEDLRGKTTVILIAHRLNTVQLADVVFLIEEGKVAARGTFSELLHTNQSVQNLVRLGSIAKP